MSLRRVRANGFGFAVVGALFAFVPNLAYAQLGAGGAGGAVASPNTAGRALTPPPPESPPPIVGGKALEIHGYLQPQFGVRLRPDALPASRVEYGALSSRAGIVFSGSPVRSFSYVLHLSLDARLLSVVTGVNLVDTNGDGVPEAVDTTKRSGVATLFEQVTVAYEPTSWLTLSLGAMRVPFTVSQKSANTALMFPSRPGPNEVFVSGADQGVLAVAHPLDDRIVASVGMFNGASLGLLQDATTRRSPLFSGRIDVAPLGKFSLTEADFDRGGFRFGLGVGGLYTSGTTFGSSGYEITETRDTRLALSVRLAFAGVFVQAEGLRRVKTDGVSSRPSAATGAYGQASIFVKVTDSVGLAPVGRIGFSSEDEVTASRRTIYYEGGIALYPAANGARPDAVRVLGQYFGENRPVEGERAHGAALQVQLLF
jgi:hypothetical protein